MVDLKTVESFLRRYNDMAQGLEEQKATEFQQAFLMLQPGFKEAMSKWEKARREGALDFNVFSVLRIQHLENETHSALLANLLNPRETHGQGTVFLQKFFDVMAGRKAERMESKLPVPDGDLSSGWDVKIQRSTGTGFMDIVVTCPKLKYLLVIENKIWGPEQPDQVHRYWMWMNADARSHYVDRVLVFLTPDGRPATTVEKGDKYYTASYTSDIVRWLKEVLQEQVLPTRLREILVQYSEVVDRIGKEASDGWPAERGPDS